MRFTEKNKIGKGRPLGSKNVATQEIRENYSNFISKNMNTIQKDFDNLEPIQRINTLISISKFILPALQSINVSQEIPNENFTPIQWENLFGSNGKFTPNI
jgi:hypothetical protein